MAFVTGKEKSLKDRLEGLKKLSKDEVVASPIRIREVIKGTSAEYGEYIMVLSDDAWVSVPKASFELFAAWTILDNEEMKNGIYYLVMEKKTASKSGRTYYTCYIHEGSWTSMQDENPFK